MTTDTKGNVLLVDDDQFFVDMFSLKFSRAGFTVHATLSADAALRALQEGFKPDVVLFDINMPQKDGYAFLQECQTKHLADGAAYIALSNQSSADEQKKALDLGSKHFILKSSMIPTEVVNIVSDEIRARRGTI